MIVWVVEASDGLICDVYATAEEAGKSLEHSWNTEHRWDDYVIRPWTVKEKYVPYGT